MNEELDQSAQEVETVEIQPDTSVNTGILPEPETEEVEQLEETLEEAEYEGKKYRLPKELKDALLRHADYTRKTQEVAETRRQIEAREQQLAQVAQIQQANIQGYAQLTAVNAQLQQFQNVDWNALTAEDPIRAQQLFYQYTNLKEQKGELAMKLHEHEQATLQNQRAMRAKALEAGQAVIAREIPDWSPEKAAKLTAYGMEQGYNEAELRDVIDPRAVKLLHKAYLYDQMVSKARAEKPVAEATPITKVTALKSAVAKDPTKMSDKEFADWRRRQIAQRNG